MSFFKHLAAAALVAATGTLFVSSAEAQQAAPDTVTTHRLPAIVSTAERESFLRRVWTLHEKRLEVIELERENRRLAHVLRKQDEQIIRLGSKLDSLKSRETEMQRQIQAIDSATAATRAARLALEARLRAMDEVIAKKGGSR